MIYPFNICPIFPSISLSNIPIEEEEEEEEHESYIIFNLTFIPILLDCKPNYSRKSYQQV